MSKYLSMITAAFALCLPGCNDEECKVDDDCPQQFVCINNHCAPCSCRFSCGCPDGYTCYGGTCMSVPPACLDPVEHYDPSSPFFQWPDDSDVEPNDHPDLAVVLPCGDDGVFTNPLDYGARCPTRAGYTDRIVNLSICPNGDRDYYAIYLLPDEVVTFNLLYQISSQQPRNLDAWVWRWDFVTNDWRDDIATGQSTDDNEELTVFTTAGSGNPQGWYYLEVRGASYEDLNYYVVSFTIADGA